MKQTKKNNNRTLSEHIVRRLREGFFILSSAIAIYLLLALATFHHTTGMEIDNVTNGGGRIGAWIAALSFDAVGYLAYLFPFMLAYGSWQMLREFSITTHHFVLRSFGFLCVLIGGAGLIALEIPARGVAHSGGILGSVVTQSLLPVLNSAGSILLLLALFCSGMTLFTGLSWIWLLDKTGRLVIKALAFVNQQLLIIKDNLLRNYYLRRERKVQLKLSKQREEPLVNLKIDVQRKKQTQKAENIEPRPSPIKVADRVHPPVRQIATRRKPSGDLPSLELLDPPEPTSTKGGFSNAKLEEMSRDVEARLKDFGIDVQVVAVHPGPVITRFEMQLAPGIKVSRISSLAKDLARSLSVVSVRIVEVIPGKPVVGLELPNDDRETVHLSEILSSHQYEQIKSPVALALGKDIAGHPVIVDLAKMPHLLVAGTTGAGKSVGINAMLIGLLYKSTPKHVRFILVDPKMLELSIYEKIPHLLTPVVTDMKEAANALRWCVAEMERRYRLMSSLGVRNLIGFNNKVSEAIKQGNPIPNPAWQDDNLEAMTLDTLPYIVVVIDEYADMMMVVGKKVEQLIARIAQKARAAGIHLILATQRPSVDVITGLIKANVPTRIAYQVSSKIDSRTIMDQGGAEQLLGHGDMLYLPPGTSVPVRVHGAFVSDDEVHRVVDDWRQRGEPQYIEAIIASNQLGEGEEGGEDTGGEKDPLYDQAVQIVTSSRRATISSIQRRLKIGYNRAARLVEEMENAGIVGPMENNGSREVLAGAPPEI